MLGVSASGPIKAQVPSTDVGAARMAPRLRASRSQLHRNCAPGTAAAMQRHDERPGAVGHIMLRNIEPESAPLAVAGGELHNPGVVVSGAAQEQLLQRIVRSQRGIEKEPVDRRQDAGERIERLQPLRQKAQRAIDAANIAGPTQRLAKAGEGGQRRIARRIERATDARQTLRPFRLACPGGLQGLVGRPDARHEVREIRRMQMARHECEHLERAQQRVEHSERGFDFRFVHVTLSLTDSDWSKAL